MEEQNNKKQKSWFEKNAWWIAVFVAIFVLRMCSELSKQ